MDSAYALVNVTRTRSWKVSLEQIRIQILSACCSFREDDISRRRMTFDRTDSTFESFERATLRTSKSYVRSYLSCLRYNKLDFLSRHYSKLPVLRFPLRSYSLCDYSISDSLTLCSSGFTYHPNTIRKEMQRKENFSFLLALSLSLSFLLPLSFACYVTYRSDTIGPTWLKRKSQLQKEKEERKKKTTKSREQLQRDLCDDPPETQRLSMYTWWQRLRVCVRCKLRRYIGSLHLTIIR